QPRVSTHTRPKHTRSITTLVFSTSTDLTSYNNNPHSQLCESTFSHSQAAIISRSHTHSIRDQLLNAIVKSPFSLVIRQTTIGEYRSYEFKTGLSYHLLLYITNQITSAFGRLESGPDDITEFTTRGQS